MTSITHAQAPTFPEGIRLVIWDLDETFWRGTLTEGGLEWLAAHEDIVKTLAARGILSSICSKNNFEQAMAPIRNRGMEGYFIFPSINWLPKGERVRSLVESCQLRPQTVLFIDDLASNRHAVLDANPGIQVTDEGFIPALVSHPALAGKPDPELTRLRQYQAMAMRQQDAQQSAHHMDDFLRRSGIQLNLHHQLEDHLDRCVELINRTNQLNFTKLRLPDDGEQAKQEFLRYISQPRIQGGLVHCRDRYGDHGFVGLYVIEEGKVLRHFLFSCRVLGMGIEQWLYHRLGRPWLQVVGEVLSDPTQGGAEVDWIALVSPTHTDPSLKPTAVALKQFDQFVVVGGCVMENIGHYLQVLSTQVVLEGNARRDGFDVRRSHTAFLAQSTVPEDPRLMQAAERVGCIASDFRNAAFSVGARSALLLSFWFDQICVLYRHRELDLELPFLIDGVRWDTDVTQLRFEDLPAEFRQSPRAKAFFDAFLEDFVFKEHIEASAYQRRVEQILCHIPAHTPVFLLDVPSPAEPGSETGILAERVLPIRQVHQALVAARPATWLIDPMQFVTKPSDRLDWWHFDRSVYFRIYTRIVDLLQQHEQSVHSG